MFKKVLLATITLILCFGTFLPAQAYEDCKSDDVDCWQRNLDENKGQQETLSGTINFLDSKIALIRAQIEQNEKELEVLEEEIVVLTAKIARLDLDLDDVSRFLISRVGEAYKRSRFKPMHLLFSSGNFSDFFQRIKYFEAVQQSDRNKLIEMQTSKDKKEEEKIKLEEKQKQVEDLKQQLSGQKVSLGGQKQEKENLLAATKNDEKKYQDLLDKARAQRAAFSSYVASQGGASILNNQTNCNIGGGCYYNQRDSSWGNQSLGGSAYSVAKYGCLVTSVAMIASHRGIDIRPSDIAAEPAAFVPGSGYLYYNINARIKGYYITRTSLASSQLDSEIAAGRPVIVGLYSSSSPHHFIVIKGKNDQGYIMHDPFMENGYNRPLSDRYNVSDIKRIDSVSFH